MRNYDPAYGGEKHENAIQYSDVVNVSNRYEDWLEEHKGVEDSAITTIMWCNFRGLFNEQRVKEFLDECSDINRPTD